VYHGPEGRGSFGFFDFSSLERRDPNGGMGGVSPVGMGLISPSSNLKKVK